jgi:hypothetical protein
VDPPVGAACVAAGLLVAQLVAAKATRDAFFLSNFPVTTLPLASGVTAGLSLGGVLAVSRAMPRWSPPVTMRRSLAASAFLLCAESALALVAPRAAALAVYAHAGVFGATLVSGFWSVINERFDPYTARHVIGRIGTGASLGGVMGGLVAWRAAGVMGVPTMLLLLAALTLACLAVLERLPHGAPAREGVAAADSPSPLLALGLIRRHPYLSNLALLVSLCAVTETALDYVLSAAVTSRYTRGAPLMSFFGLYHTAVGVLALALQTLVTRRSLERLGLGGSLSVQPVVVAIGGALAAAVPGLWPRVAVRGAQAVLRSSVFRSAYELLYTPLAPEQKRPTKALLDVGADRLGAIAGSAAVLLALLFPAWATLLLLMLASALAVAAVALARRLQAGYVSALAESLRAGTVQLDPGEVKDPATRALLTGAGPRERPAAAEPAEIAPGPLSESAVEPLLDAAAALRSRDRDRIERVLRDPAMAVELVPLVVPLLGRDDLFSEAVASLRRVGPRCTGQLVDVLLDAERPLRLRRRIPRAKYAPMPGGRQAVFR